MPFPQRFLAAGTMVTMMGVHSVLRLRTVDDVPIVADLYEQPTEHAFVIVHGFTGSGHSSKITPLLPSFTEKGTVLALDMRGHGRSGSHTTMGMDEVLDVDVAVGALRDRGYSSITTVGFSLGGAVVTRHAALAPAFAHTPTFAPNSTISVSAPAFWYYQGTRPTRLVHQLIFSKAGRAALRARGTTVGSEPWPEPAPISPEDAAASFVDYPYLIVHGDRDHYFPMEHADALWRASAQNTGAERWVWEGFAHAESAMTVARADALAAWAVSARAK